MNPCIPGIVVTFQTTCYIWTRVISSIGDTCFPSSCGVIVSEIYQCFCFAGPSQTSWTAAWAVRHGPLDDVLSGGALVILL
jgi:hypothetical protein